MKIKIAHMYPDLLNLYGDKGNITALCKRLEWRNIEAEVVCFNLDDKVDFSDIDIVFLGGGSDREQQLVCKKLLEQKERITDFAENNGCLVAVCGGYQLLGKYYKLESETIEGLGIMDFYTEQKKDRLIGKVVLESDLIGGRITGFENHGGRTFSSLPALGKVLYGNGNNGKDKKEGSVYKNVIGTYLHGPVLPANPALTDLVLKRAVDRKYGGNTELAPLDDAPENAAREYIIKKYL